MIRFDLFSLQNWILTEDKLMLEMAGTVAPELYFFKILLPMFSASVLQTAN